jgi:hypothetical protein
MNMNMESMRSTNSLVNLQAGLRMAENRAKKAAKQHADSTGRRCGAVRSLLKLADGYCRIWKGTKAPNVNWLSRLAMESGGCEEECLPVPTGKYMHF